MARGPILLLTLGSLVLMPHPAHAHEDAVSSSDVALGDRQLVWRVDVPAAALVDAGRLLRGDAASARAARDEIGAYLAREIEIEADGRRLAPELGALTVEGDGKSAAGATPVARVVQTITFHSPGPLRKIRATVGLFAEQTSSHRALVHLHGPGSERQIVRRGPFTLAFDARDLTPTTASVVWEFLRWGTHHIFVGYDHIVFLLALLLAVTRLRELLAIVTSFTVAHSVTLCLAGLGLLRIPARLCEVAIAASIVYVAIDNLRATARPRPRRWLLTFLFGLVHGLGFATALQERLTELNGHVLLPVLSFNLGVEVGQVAIVALLFPLLTWMRRAPTERERQLRRNRLLRMGSVPILIVGLFWLVDRALG